VNKKRIMKKRLLAAMVDLAFVSAVDVLLCWLLSVCGAAMWIRIASCSVVTVAYFTVFDASPLAATPGMAIFKLWIVYKKSGNVFLQALLRFLFAILTCLPFGFGFWYGFISPKGVTVFDVATDSSVETFGQDNRSGKVPCVFKVGEDRETVFYKVAKGGIIFGRDPKVCNVLFPADAGGISRSHCNVSYNEQTGLFLIEDLCSSYGTFKEDGTQIFPGKTETLSIEEKFYLARKSNLYCVGFKEEENGTER